MKTNRSLSLPRRFGRRRRGVTLVEVVIASAISSVLMIGLMSTFVLIRKFLQDSFYENLLRQSSSQFLERAQLLVNYAYRNDATLANLRYTIGANNDTITFWTPDANASGAAEKYQYVYDADDRRLNLIHNNVQVDQLRRVANFDIINQEGLVTFVVTVDATFSVGRQRHTRQFTQVLRALPRNMGTMPWKGVL